MLFVRKLRLFVCSCVSEFDGVFCMLVVMWGMKRLKGMKLVMMMSGLVRVRVSLLKF